jgi:hypothetical protein
MAYDRKTAEDYLQALGSLEQMFGKGQSAEAGGSIVNPVVPGDRPDATSTDTNAAKKGAQ